MGSSLKIYGVHNASVCFKSQNDLLKYSKNKIVQIMSKWNIINSIEDLMGAME